LHGDAAIAIVGICKNAGKTSLLNHLLALRGEQVWGVFSTGIDGEETDTVFKIPKPRVRLGPGIIFCCDTPILDSHGSSVSVLEKLAFSAPLRPLWLAQSEIPIQTEITGPATLSGQINALERMQSLGAEKVLIDGSLDRKSIALSDAVDGVALLIGASFGSIPQIIAELKRLELLNRITAYSDTVKGYPEYCLLLDSEQVLVQRDKEWEPSGMASLLGDEKELRALLERPLRKIYIPGAITDAVFSRIKEPLQKAGPPIVLRHPDCLKLSYPKLEQFAKEFSAQALIPFKIRSFVLNSMSVGTQTVDAAEFRGRLRGEFPHLDLPDIRELEI